MEERSTDRLARYILYTAGILLVLAACWMLRSILAYIFGAVVLALICKPVKHLLGKFSVKGRRAPEWLLSAVSIILVAALALFIMTQVFPVVTSVLGNISAASATGSSPLKDLNNFIIRYIPKLGKDFRIEKIIVSQIQQVGSMSTLSSILGSVASAAAGVAITAFSVIFISFFFLKEESLFSKIVCAFVPDRIEESVTTTIKNIETLLSRYFVGLVVEIAGVAFLNFIGLWSIARLNFSTALGIGVLTGLLNIIPYVGPLTGGVIGTILGMIVRFYGVSPVGMWLSDGWFIAALIMIFAVTQLVDNFFFQPVIYSTSIRCHPLEIFLVILIVGHFGGVLWMIAAIPMYTCIRVIAGQFFRGFKPIGRLIPEDSLIAKRRRGSK